VGFVVAKWHIFFEYFGCPCQFSFYRLLHTHHLSSGAGTIGHLVADVPSGLSFTPHQETKKKASWFTRQKHSAHRLLTTDLVYVASSRKMPDEFGRTRNMSWPYSGTLLISWKGQFEPSTCYTYSDLLGVLHNDFCT
jgi:hypothetical protein